MSCRAIPFENLDIVLRRGFISLECEDLERKLVAGGRGGYCFENNLLLCLALRSLGFGATPMLARVQSAAAGDALLARPSSHV